MVESLASSSNKDNREIRSQYKVVRGEEKAKEAKQITEMSFTWAPSEMGAIRESGAESIRTVIDPTCDHDNTQTQSAKLNFPVNTHVPRWLGIL